MSLGFFFFGFFLTETYAAAWSLISLVVVFLSKRVREETENAHSGLKCVKDTQKPIVAEEHGRMEYSAA